MKVVQSTLERIKILKMESLLWKCIIYLVIDSISYDVILGAMGKLKGRFNTLSLVRQQI